MSGKTSSCCWTRSGRRAGGRPAAPPPVQRAAAGGRSARRDSRNRSGGVVRRRRGGDDELPVGLAPAAARGPPAPAGSRTAGSGGPAGHRVPKPLLQLPEPMPGPLGLWVEPHAEVAVGPPRAGGQLYRGRPAGDRLRCADAVVGCAAARGAPGRGTRPPGSRRPRTTSARTARYRRARRSRRRRRAHGGRAPAAGAASG